MKYNYTRKQLVYKTLYNFTFFFILVKEDHIIGMITIAQTKRAFTQKIEHMSFLIVMYCHISMTHINVLTQS